jgi:NAD(P)-dependent dehydrogenase (short-subunit alcohol dehydrogenase family)
MGAAVVMPELDNLRSLRPVRVLVAGRDERYGRAIAFLLARSGYETRRVRHARPLLGDARVEAADIVLFEGEVSPDEVLAEATALVAEFPHLAVVVVAGRHGPSPDGRLQFVEKWTELEEVVAAVNRGWAAIGPTAGRRFEPESEAVGRTLRVVHR